VVTRANDSTVYWLDLGNNASRGFGAEGVWANVVAVASISTTTENPEEFMAAIL
jgi:hypothetical protein